MTKRPDQHNIDPSEAGATDYKTKPQTGRGNTPEDDTVDLDKQTMAEARADAESQPFPPSRPRPTRDVRRKQEEEGKGDEDE